MSLENRKKRKEKKSYCCDSYTSLDYVLRNSLAPTVEDLVGVLYEVAVKNHRLVAMKKPSKSSWSQLEVLIVITSATSVKEFIY